MGSEMSTMPFFSTPLFLSPSPSFVAPPPSPRPPPPPRPFAPLPPTTPVHPPFPVACDGGVATLGKPVFGGESIAMLEVCCRLECGTPYMGAVKGEVSCTQTLEALVEQEVVRGLCQVKEDLERIFMPSSSDSTLNSTTTWTSVDIGLTRTNFSVTLPSNIPCAEVSSANPPSVARVRYGTLSETVHNTGNVALGSTVDAINIGSPACAGVPEGGMGHAEGAVSLHRYDFEPLPPSMEDVTASPHFVRFEVSSRGHMHYPRLGMYQKFRWLPWSLLRSTSAEAALGLCLCGNGAGADCAQGAVHEAGGGSQKARGGPSSASADEDARTGSVSSTAAPLIVEGVDILANVETRIQASSLNSIIVTNGKSGVDDVEVLPAIIVTNGRISPRG